jgi:hypothetical protein
MEDATQSPSEPTPLYKHAARWGLIAGVINIVLFIVYYVVDLGLMVDWKVGIFTMVLYIGFAIYAGITYRGEIGGYMAYGKAFQHGFILFAVSALLSSVFNILLYNVIDPELPAKLTDVTIEKTEQMMRGFGLDEAALEKAMEDTRGRMEGQFTIVGTIKSYGIFMVVAAVLALITSLFVRKNEPLEM